MQENGDVVKLLSQMLGKFDELTSEVKYLRRDTNEQFNQLRSDTNTRFESLEQEVENLSMKFDSSFNHLYGAVMTTSEEIQGLKETTETEMRHLRDALHEIISILSKDVVFFGLPVVLETPEKQYSGVIRKP